MGLQLYIKTDQDSHEYSLSIGKDTDDTVTRAFNDVKCTVQLIDLSFEKQMYKQGHIVAKLHISPIDSYQQGSDKSFFLLSKDFLRKYFLESTVKLTESSNANNVIANNYVVYDVVPVYASESLYVDLIIYSPDKVLATTIDSSSYVAKKLGAEILAKKYSDKYTVSLQNGLSYDNGSEYIHPYLVQYNESFYDFLIRTANRWGEFVYCEESEGKLVLGRTIYKDTGDKDLVKTISSYKSLSYLDVSHGKTIAENCKKAVVTDDYLEEMSKYDSKKDAKTGYIQAAGDQTAHDAVYNHRIMQSFVSMNGSIFDWTVNTFSDEAMLAKGNETIRKKKNSTICDESFISGSSDDRISSTDKSKCRLFATYKNGGGLTVNAYKDVLDKEITAAQNVIRIHLGPNYQHLRLGEVICFEGNDVSENGGTYQPKYLVAGVKCENLQYSIIAVKQVNALSDPSPVFYPPMLPSGHVRTSGPQRGTVEKTNDPALNGRYRVRIDAWPNSAGNPTPWIRVARESRCAVWRLEQGTDVLLDFDDGNVELPYIVGALQKTNAKSNNRASLFNNMDFTTPAGHAMRLTDGEGGGFAAFLSSFIPIWNIIQTCNPDRTKGAPNINDKEYYEGGMELTDKFGIYSIKASTDKRNISIKSSWGDININAFTGITISAPNGDVKIQGKNVSIEAGNKLNIVSGKNIYNGILGSGIHLGGGEGGFDGMAFLGDMANMAGKKIAGWLDLPFIRNVVEVLLRPIGGTLEIKSYRNMLLQAGINKDETEGAKLQKLVSESDYKKVLGKAGEWIMKNWNILDVGTDLTYRFMDTADNNIWRAPNFGTIQLKSVTNKATYWDSKDVFGGTNNPPINKGNYLGMDKLETEGALAQKADQATVNAALAQKADYSDIIYLQTWAQGLFATQTVVNKKADKDYVDTELTKKADKTYVDTELTKKADKSYVDNNFVKIATITAMQSALDQKADKTATENALNQKADKNDLDQKFDTISHAMNDLNTRLEQHLNSEFVHAYYYSIY